MPELNVSERLKNKINLFTDKLKSIYADELVSVIIYGSAASNEFTDIYSDLNLLIVLKDAGLANLKKFSKSLAKFERFQPLFLSETYISNSTDTFPIEFLDMQENYRLLYGKDLLKGLRIDLTNLRFQCEQEIKIKLIGLRQLYLRSNNEAALLKPALLKTFTSVLHICRNILRLKDKPIVYRKNLIITDLSKIIPIDIAVWERLLFIKNNGIKLCRAETERLFVSFTNELEKVADYVDKL